MVQNFWVVGRATTWRDPSAIELRSGSGGPNQEAAIAAALELEGAPVAAIFLDTDGSDGGTEHAGAIVDGLTVERAAGLGLDLRSALLEHRSHAALVTGPTGTNVNDLFAIVIKEDQ